MNQHNGRRITPGKKLMFAFRVATHHDVAGLGRHRRTPTAAAKSLGIVPVQQSPRIKQSASFMCGQRSCEFAKLNESSRSVVKADRQQGRIMGLRVRHVHRKQADTVRPQPQKNRGRQMLRLRSRD
jgi:hypothetical protein